MSNHSHRRLLLWALCLLCLSCTREYALDMILLDRPAGIERMVISSQIGGVSRPLNPSVLPASTARVWIPLPNQDSGRILETAQGIQLVGAEGLALNEGQIRAATVLVDSSKASVNSGSEAINKHLSQYRIEQGLIQAVNAQMAKMFEMMAEQEGQQDDQ